MRQTILHSITDIVAVAAADVMDMEKEKDKDKDRDRAGDSISRTLTVRRPRFRESNNYKSLNASTERGGHNYCLETRAFSSKRVFTSATTRRGSSVPEL